MDAVKTANMAQEMGDGQKTARTEAQQREMEAKMMRSGLNVVWKMGKLLLEERCRRVCEIMFSKDSRRVEPLANALIQVHMCVCVWVFGCVCARARACSERESEREPLD